MTNPNTTKRIHRIRRHIRVRAKISGTAERPRVAVFKAHQHVYAQAIDDVARRTVAAVNDAQIKGKGTKTEHALAVGKKLAELLTKQGIKAVVFDVSGFRYHGRVRAVAEGLRESGMTV